MYICESRTLSFHLSLSHVPWHCWNCNMQQTTNMIIGNWIICLILEYPVWSPYLENESDIVLLFHFNIQYVRRKRLITWWVNISKYVIVKILYMLKKKSSDSFNGIIEYTKHIREQRLVVCCSHWLVILYYV